MDKYKPISINIQNRETGEKSNIQFPPLYSDQNSKQSTEIFSKAQILNIQLPSNPIIKNISIEVDNNMNIADNSGVFITLTHSKYYEASRLNFLMNRFASQIDLRNNVDIPDQLKIQTSDNETNINILLVNQLKNGPLVPILMHLILDIFNLSSDNNANQNQKLQDISISHEIIIFVNDESDDLLLKNFDIEDSENLPRVSSSEQNENNDDIETNINQRFFFYPQDLRPINRSKGQYKILRRFQSHGFRYHNIILETPTKTPNPINSNALNNLSEKLGYVSALYSKKSFKNVVIQSGQYYK